MNRTVAQARLSTIAASTGMPFRCTITRPSKIQAMACAGRGPLFVLADGVRDLIAYQSRPRSRQSSLIECFTVTETKSTTGTATPSTAFSETGIVDLADATILIVDDNLQNLELMQAYLEELPCRILPAKDGIEAVALVEEHTPNLILLDVMMPRMSGFEVCQKIKANPATRDIVVIMVTALHEVGDFERAVECGTNDFITKPVNKLELITRVRSLLELSLLKRRYDEMLSLSQRVGPDEGSREEAGQKLE